MNITQDQRRKWNFNFFKSKIKEFDFYLREVVECCDQSMLRFKAAQQGEEQAGNKIVFAYSAFVNTIQALKDGGSTFLDTEITWGDIADMRHGKFMGLSRNAATHDGHPIITAWADGYYFVPADIHRLGSRGDLIKIEAPTEDVGQFCLEFSRDFSDFISSRIQVLGSTEFGGFIFNIDELEQGFNSDLVPEFARQLFHDKKIEIEKYLGTLKNDPGKDALVILSKIIDFCDDNIEKRKWS